MGCCDGAKRVATGAAKRAKSALNIGIADESTVEQRRAICRGCEAATPCEKQRGKKCYCADCGCPLQHKTRLKSETCPRGKW